MNQAGEQGTAQRMPLSSKGKKKSQCLTPSEACPFMRPVMLSTAPRLKHPLPMLAVAGLLLYPLPAAAYIDPGTGSALFYVVTGLVVSVYFAVRSLYYRAIDWFFRISRKDQRCEIAIHCEDPRYEITFLPIVRALDRRGIEVTLFTMYPRDASFDALPERAIHRAIPEGMMGYAYLNNIEAALLVTTTPQLDVMTFRRSRRVRHYAIVQHALGESRFVRPYAYDHFDSVLCCGPIVKANIERIESIRQARQKNLLETGVPHYDEMLKAARRTPPLQGEPVVLIAPSWGPLSMFEAFGTGFVKRIAERFRVIVRPHPQMKVSQPALYAEILGLEGVEVSTDRTPVSALSRSHILLSDISGIAHEFAFIYERPVVVIDRQMKSGGLEGELLGGDSELKQQCRDFIVPVQPADIDQIADHLDRVLRSHSIEALEKVRDQVIYNFGRAGDVAARQLEELYTIEKAKDSLDAREAHA
jgi:CDP-Glycerol:Poly(glycerophosphate) glycerophosphotransferase